MATIGRLAYQVVADTQQFAQGMVATRNEVRQARQLFLDSRSPAEQFGMAMDALGKQFQKGLVDADTYGRQVTILKSELAEMDGSAQRARDSQKQLADEQRRAAEEAKKLAAEQAAVSREQQRVADAAEKATQARASQIFEQTRTPAERYRTTMRELSATLNEGRISQDTFNRAAAQARTSLQQQDGTLARIAQREREAADAARQLQREQEQIASRGRAVFESVRTPAERYAHAVRDLQHLLRQGAIDQNTFNRAVRQAQGDFTRATGGTEALRAALGATSSGSRLLALAVHPAALAVGAIAIAATAATAAIAALAAGMATLIAKSVQSAANFEQTSVAFNVMLGSADEAQKLLERIEEFTKSTPFEFDEVTQAARKLLGFGFAAGEIIPLLRRLGDLSAGLQIPIGDLAAIYGKVQQKGKLFAEELNQLAERGIPVVALLAQQFGVTEQEVRKLAEQGKVSFSDFQQAIETMTNAGGQFAGMTQAQADTVLGAWSNLKDEISSALRQIGQEILAGFDLKAAIIGVAEFVQTLTTAVLPIFRILAEDVQMIFASFGGFDAVSVARGIAVVADWVHKLAIAWELTQVAILGAMSAYLHFQGAVGLGGEEWAQEIDKMIGKRLIEIAMRAGQSPSRAVEKAIEDMRRRQREDGNGEGSPSEDAEKRKKEADEAKRAADEAQRAAEAAKEAKRLQDQVGRDAKRVYEETRTPLERFNAKFADLTKLVSIGAIDWETYRRAVAAAKDELKKADDAASGAAERQRELEGNAKRFTEAAKTPLQKYQEEVTRIKDAFAAGLIDEGVATNALERAGKEFNDAAKKGRIPGVSVPSSGSNKAVEAGTAEAFSEILRHRRGGNSPNQKLEDISNEQLVTLQQIKDEIRGNNNQNIIMAIN